MRILVAERIAQEGVERLRARHEVDERVGLGPEEYATGNPDLRDTERRRQDFIESR